MKIWQIVDKKAYQNVHTWEIRLDLGPNEHLGDSEYSRNQEIQVEILASHLENL